MSQDSEAIIHLNNSLSPVTYTELGDEHSCYVDRLNDDLLYEVMSYIAAEEIAEEDLYGWERRRNGRPAVIVRPPRDLYFPESAMLISRRWRFIASANARLWTRIRVDLDHPPNRTKQWLGRAGQAPLELCWIRADENPFDEVAKQWGKVEDLDEWVNNLLPHLHRVVYLSIDFGFNPHPNPLPNVLSELLMKVARSPSLHSLHFHHFGEYPLCRQINVTPDAFPNLRVLAAMATAIPWKSMKRLKRLELGWIYSEREDGNEPSWEELQNLLASSPELEEISLRHIDDFHDTGMTVMHLPIFHHLHTLKLNGCAKLFRLILPALHAPNLTYFCLRFDPAEGFLKNTALLGLPRNLRRLKVASLRHTYVALQAFLTSGLTDLESLELEDMYGSTGTLFSAELINAMGYCAQLRHLDLWRVHPNADRVEEMARRRVEDEMPLETVCFRDPVSSTLVNALVQLGVKVTVIAMGEDVHGPYGEVQDGDIRD
ncbi:hypothetical protein FRB93_008322 [Tulasnella sp. JGI-2019a]|nr:hypothetical protein FRB93_008322 [Tulasnella sp. JGI-2019a]